MLGLAPGGVCLAGPVTWTAGGLLHHRFTLTAWPGGRAATCFLLHLPSSRLAWALPSTALYGVRTFLTTENPSRDRPAHSMK